MLCRRGKVSLGQTRHDLPVSMHKGKGYHPGAGDHLCSPICHTCQQLFVQLLFMSAGDFVEVLSIRGNCKHFLKLWGTSGTTHCHSFINVALFGLGILQRSLHWLRGTTEEISSQPLNVSSGNRSVEIHAHVE